MITIIIQPTHIAFLITTGWKTSNLGGLYPLRHRNSYIPIIISEALNNSHIYPLSACDTLD